MSRWTQNKYKFKKSYTVYNQQYMVYKVITDQKTFIVRAFRLDYKKTRENLINAGYTGINFVCLGRDVTI